MTFAIPNLILYPFVFILSCAVAACFDSFVLSNIYSLTIAIIVLICIGQSIFLLFILSKKLKSKEAQAFAAYAKQEQEKLFKKEKLYGIFTRDPDSFYLNKDTVPELVLMLAFLAYFVVF